MFVIIKKKLLNQVVYYNHAQHQHHYDEHEGEGGGGGGTGYWRRSIIRRGRSLNINNNNDRFSSIDVVLNGRSNTLSSINDAHQIAYNSHISNS